VNEHEINSAAYNTNSAQKAAVSIPSDAHANETETSGDMESQSDFRKPVKHYLINKRIVFSVILIIAIYAPVGLFIIRQLQLAMLRNDAPQKNTEATMYSYLEGKQYSKLSQYVLSIANIKSQNYLKQNVYDNLYDGEEKLFHI